MYITGKVVEGQQEGQRRWQEEKWGGVGWGRRWGGGEQEEEEVDEAVHFVVDPLLEKSVLTLIIQLVFPL